MDTLVNKLFAHRRTQPGNVFLMSFYGRFPSCLHFLDILSLKRQRVQFAAVFLRVGMRVDLNSTASHGKGFKTRCSVSKQQQQHTEPEKIQTVFTLKVFTATTCMHAAKIKIKQRANVQLRLKSCGEPNGGLSQGRG